MIGKWWCQEHGAYPDTYVWIYYQSGAHQGNHYDRHMAIKDEQAVAHVLWSLHGGTSNSTGTLYTPSRWHWPEPEKPSKISYKKTLYRLWKQRRDTQNEA